MPPKKTTTKLFADNPSYTHQEWRSNYAVYMINKIQSTRASTNAIFMPHQNQKKIVSQQKWLHRTSPQNLKNKKWELDKFALSGITRHSHNISKIGSQHNYWASSHKPNENGIQHNFLVGGYPPLPLWNTMGANTICFI